MTIERTFEVYAVRRPDRLIPVRAAIERYDGEWVFVFAFLPDGQSPIKWEVSAELLVSAFQDEAAMNREIFLSVVRRGKQSNVRVTLTGVNEESNISLETTFIFPYMPLRALAQLAQDGGCPSLNYATIVDSLIERIFTESRE